MQDNRFHVRTPHKATVRLIHSLEEIAVTLKDISVGGVYLEMDDISRFQVGDIVQLQIQGTAQETPEIEAEVVRVSDSGMGLKFCQLEESDLDSADN